MSFITISEDLHHGQFRFHRTEKVPITREGILAFMQRSPYATDTLRAGNTFVERTIDRLLAGRRAGFGWSWYTPQQPADRPARRAFTSTDVGREARTC